MLQRQPVENAERCESTHSAIEDSGTVDVAFLEAQASILITI